MWPSLPKIALRSSVYERWPVNYPQSTSPENSARLKVLARCDHKTVPIARNFGPCLHESSKTLPLGGGSTSRSEDLARLETILFVTHEPLGARKLAQLADLADGTEARTLVGKLNRLYDTEHRAFHVIEVGGGFQLRTRAQFGPWLTRLHSATIEVRLSAPAMETLAVVAYRQPVLRATVEAIRGVQCGEMLRQLMERDLVRIAGRSLELGRPFLYGTTKRFLQVFGLGSIDDLPHREWFKSESTEPLPEESNEDDSADNDEQNDQETEPTEPIHE